MLSKTQFPGHYIQGYNATEVLGEQVSQFGSTCFAVCDPFVYENLWQRYDKTLTQKLKVQNETFGGECSDEEVQRLAEKAGAFNSEVVIGIGGGKTLDTAKAVAHALNVPVAIVPTLASTDAPCSALSVIYTPDGQFKRYLILPRNPEIVLVDTKVISEAPPEFFAAGMGDALATWFEAQSCQQACSPNMSGMKGSVSAFTLAELCYELLLEHGYEALCACRAGAVTPAFEHIVEANTLLSGLGFESGGLGAAHSIHNGLTMLEQAHDKSHGQKVAFGVLASLIMTDRPAGLIEEVYAFCASIDLPTTFAEIDLEGVDREQLMTVAQRACAEGETIHNEPMPVDEQMVVNALIAADALGRARKERH